MSDVGEDIKDAYREVGIDFSVIRDSDISEYCILRNNRQVTKPFVREFFQEASFSYDTDVISGDIIQASDGRNLMIMNLTPALLSNEVIKYDGVAYKCNVSGQIYRYSGETTYDSNFALVAAPVLIRDDCYALLTEALYGNDLEENEEIGLLGLKQNELYIPASYGIKVHDRYQISETEYYRIESISKRKYDNVWVAIVGEDNR